MQYLPLFLDLHDRPVLVIGAGEVALRKLESLQRAGASVRIVAREVSTAVRELAADAGYPVSERGFQLDDLEGVWLVLAAAGDADLNGLLRAACEDRRLFLNVVDDTASCSAIFPSVVDRDPVLVAISTAGRSPTLARLVRAWIEDLLPQGLGRLATFIGEQRGRVAERWPVVRDRQHFWDQLFARRPVGEMQRELEAGVLLPWFDQQLDRVDAQALSTGRVALVGAGPGDPELITLRGLNLLRRADVVFYDNLVSRDLLARARRDAEVVYVGKRRAGQSTSQATINSLMREAAEAGNEVVRLKGGDPFIFARGGEELAYLLQHGIETSVVPGISAAMGGASYAGIPLTHRDASQSVRFVTGHRASDRANLDWPELAKAEQTLVIYMGLPELGLLMQRLMEHGRAPETPAALIDRATLPEQQVVLGTIANLAQRVAAAQVRGPTLIVVGEVVAYRAEGAMPRAQEFPK